jgi:hypothetical protein
MTTPFLIEQKIRALGYTAQVVPIYDHWGFILRLQGRVVHCSKKTYKTSLLAWEVALGVVISKTFD